MAKNFFSWFIVDMQVNNIQSTNFKSGLTKQILAKEKLVNPKKVEYYFKTSPYGCRRYDFKNIDFQDNKAYALAFRMCAEIFKNFSKMHNYGGCPYVDAQVFPSDLIVFNEEDLSDNLSPDEKKTYMNTFMAISSHVSKNDAYFKNQKNDISMGTIIVPNIFDNLKQINKNAESTSNKRNHFHSSNHFLHLFIHEWIHALADFYVYRESSCNSSSQYEATINGRKLKKLNDKEIKIVKDILGNYSAKADEYQYDEVFAEAWTKFICESLDEDCMHFKTDPVSEMQKTPKSFQKILKKVSTLKLYKHNYIKGEDKPSLRSPICFHPVQNIS